MSAQQSNLSGSQWMYDMVVGVTQDSINYTMLQFLKKFEGATIEYYEVFNPKYNKRTNPNVPRTLPSDAATVNQIAGKDIFSIKMDSEEAYAIAEGKSFSLAIRGKLGVPNYPGVKVLDTVKLDQGYGTKVSFRMCYKELEIIYVAYDSDGPTLNKFVQNKDNFFSFTFVVDLNMREENDGFETLTKAQKDLLKNLNPDTMFSVNQLYLDLTAPKLQSTPVIIGIDKTTPEGQLIVRILQDCYWDKLHRSSTGGVVLGSAVLPKRRNPNLENPSLIPTNLNFMVMPYIDTDGKPMKENQGYSTLNYLITSEGRKLNPPSQLGWNWIQAGNQAHGVMAIRKENIFRFFKSNLDKATKNLFYEPHARIQTKAFSAEVTVDLNRRESARQFQINDKDLSLEYTASAQDKGGAEWGWWEKKINVSGRVYSKVTFSGNKILLRLEVLYQIAFEDGKVTGPAKHKTATIFGHEQTYKFETTVNKEGKLMVSYTKPILAKATFDVDYIVSFKVDQVFGDAIQEMKNSMNNLERELADLATNLESLFNNSNAWVFPGGNTFAFKEVGFSDNLDLVTHITYANPN